MEPTTDESDNRSHYFECLKQPQSCERIGTAVKLGVAAGIGTASAVACNWMAMNNVLWNCFRDTLSCFGFILSFVAF